MVLLAVILLFITQINNAQSREIAITIDDLPIVSKIQDKDWMLGITDSLISHLKKYEIPATGFIIKSKVITPDSIDIFKLGLLKRWMDAGIDLGNHTYSHPSLNKVSSSEYITDITQGDEIFNKIKPGFKPELFRHPFLHTGRDSITRITVENFLKDNGYTIATVSVDNADYIYASAYEKCIREKDYVTQKKVGEDYVSYMERVVEYYENQSKALLGYEIKQIFLMHANKLNADYLDELAQMLISRGYKFISVKEALKDPAYKLSDTYFGAGGISWLHRWALTQGKRGEFFKGEPEVPEFVDSLYNN